MLRQIYGYESTTRLRITELEQTDDWMGALTEYGSLQAEVGRRADPALVQAPAPALAGAPAVSPSGAEAEALERLERLERLEARAEVERGRLRCLMEIGHLEAVVDQVRPYLALYRPHLGPYVCPYLTLSRGRRGPGTSPPRFHLGPSLGPYMTPI